MSCNFGEIIKKLYSLWKWAKPSRHSRLPPTSSQVVMADFPHGGEKCASCRRRFHSPNLLAGWRGEGGVICESLPFDNGSSDWAQIQHEDVQWCSSPLLFRQDLPNSLPATFGELWRVYIVKRGYKREPELRLALSRRYYILQATPLCERRKSATATHVEQ
jgi:hypothetical protein